MSAFCSLCFRFLYQTDGFSGDSQFLIGGNDHDRYFCLIGGNDPFFPAAIVLFGNNIRNVLRITGGDPEGKIRRLLDYTGHPRDIDDPWYSGDFAKACADITAGCEALLKAGL